MLSEIKQVVDESVAACEVSLEGTAGELRELLADIENERNQVQGVVEERDLDRMLRGDRNLQRGPGTTELRRHEDSLIQEYTRVSALYRQLTDFVHLLTASRQQFRSDEALLGMEDAQRLAIRQAMIRAQEDERQRLAREIHDGPAQVLANAIIGLEFIERSLKLAMPQEAEQAIEEIERVKSSMREGLTEIRRFIFDLRPSMLAQRGLAATVEHYIETYRQFFSAEVELALPKHLPRLTPDQEMTAFRVIQESLQNVHRHSRSTKAWVSVSVTPDGLTVRVRDNGQGFRPSAVLPTAASGFGLNGMRERAEVIGGRITVRSAPERGTDVTLVIPLTTPSVDPLNASQEPADAEIKGESAT